VKNSAEPAGIGRSKILPLPPLKLRVALNAGQAITYSKRFNLDIHTMAMFFRIFTNQSQHFEEKYKSKVRGEYQWAQFKRKLDKEDKRIQEGNDEHNRKINSNSNTNNSCNSSSNGKQHRRKKGSKQPLGKKW